MLDEQRILLWMLPQLRIAMRAFSLFGVSFCGNVYGIYGRNFYRRNVCQPFYIYYKQKIIAGMEKVLNMKATDFP
jgi:hypothetical protein